MVNFTFACGSETVDVSFRVMDAILVAGAGALGSVVGGLLARHGLPVTLLGRAPHLQTVRTRGLKIEGLFGNHHVPGVRCAFAVSELHPPYATILLTVKSYDTTTMLAAVAPLLAPKGAVLVMQNGLGNLEAAAAAVGTERVLGARVIFGAELAAPGVARVTVCADPVLVGSPDPADHGRQAMAAEWASIFEAAGMPCAPTSTLVPELWAKALYNAALNPLGALLGVPYGYLATDADLRMIMDAAIDEGFAVARADGITLRWPDAPAYRTEFYSRLVPATAGHRSSMLQDLARGRPTEIEAINGYFVRRGMALGVPTPTNAVLTRLIRARTRRARASEVL